MITLTIHCDQLMSSFRAAGRLSVMFGHLSLPPGHLTSTSISFPFGWEIFRHFPPTFHAAGNLALTSVNCPCCREIICKYPSIFWVPRRPFFNLRQVSLRPGDLPSYSVNFLCGQETFHQVPSTCRAAGRHSVNFHQLS